ncbi:MAG: hypothetical protein C0601_06840 [Candidatus Muiribacterium halophilum]|uniref:Uncharacterized protein n=1 Tax=Muiribacterium halophilum TaxID=2053465 RepID=A0A2N5ZGG6_MUIH1|nr:MAG: hypothetical protein C0601_06840 [Candidatus Muirbacterium halophilum]
MSVSRRQILFFIFIVFLTFFESYISMGDLIPFHFLFHSILWYIFTFFICYFILRDLIRYKDYTLGACLMLIPAFALRISLLFHENKELVYIHNDNIIGFIKNFFSFTLHSNIHPFMKIEIISIIIFSFIFSRWFLKKKLLESLKITFLIYFGCFIAGSLLNAYQLSVFDSIHTLIALNSILIILLLKEKIRKIAFSYFFIIFFISNIYYFMFFNLKFIQVLLNALISSGFWMLFFLLRVMALDLFLKRTNNSSFIRFNILINYTILLSLSSIFFLHRSYTVIIVLLFMIDNIIVNRPTKEIRFHMYFIFYPIILLLLSYLFNNQ